MIRIPLETTPDFMWLGKETTFSTDWIHYARSLHEYELMIVDKGTLYIADEHGKYTVSQGQYILMPPCEHQYGWKPSACSFYWLHFGIDKQRTVRSANCPYVQKKTAASPAVLEFPNQGNIHDFSSVQTLLSQIFRNEQFYSDTTQAAFLLSALLLELYNQVVYGSVLSSESTRAGISMQKEDLCKKIKNYIHWNRTHRIKITDIAEHLRYSEKHLSSVFAEITGTRLKSYIDEQQMESAKEFLSNSKNSISEISFQLGYSDSHNFSRAFKRITGMSPKEYRNSSGRHNTRP